MIKIQRKEDCCGCSACMSACPVHCIEMKEDKEGFIYPQVDSERCINCHKCEKVCPVINNPINDRKPEAFLARTKDSNLLQKCTSGGVFTEIAREIIKHGGIVYGVVYADDFKVQHERIADLEGIERLPGSKYVQSDVGITFSQVKEDVEAGKQVVFCGTPCQVAGLRKHLGKDYKNILLIDLICHGVPSPKLWENYVEYLEQRHGKLKYANFRSKRLGYHVSVMEEQFENGKSQIGSARTNLMSKCFFQNVADRPICYVCPFKTVSRCSDITIFDGWHASDYVVKLEDDNKGYTIILTQSDKGREYIKGVNNFILYEIVTDKAIALDGRMATNSVQRPQSRDIFYELLDQKGIEETVQILFPISKIDHLIDKSKLLLDKVGVLQKIKRLRK